MVVAVTDETRGDSGSDALLQGKDEINLAMLPIAVASTKQPRRTDGTKEYKHVIKSKRWDDHLEAWVPATITFKSNPDDGLVTTVDEQYLVAWLKFLYDANQFTDTEVEITPHQLFDLMKLKGRGNDYDRLEIAVQRWAAITIVYEGSWWDDNRDEYLDTVTLSILPKSYYRRPKNTNNRVVKGGKLLLRFEKDFVALLHSGVVKNLNLDQYYAFKHPLAARLYRVLDRHFYDDNEYEIDLRVFACGQCGLADTHDNGQLKRKLNPAIKELEDAKFIVSVPVKERYRKVKAGIWRVKFTRERNPGEAEILQELLDRGVSPGVARSLVAEYAPDYVRGKVDFLDWKMHTQDPGAEKNPPGFLVAAIRNDYQPPKGFKNREQLAAAQQARQRRAVKKQQQKSETAAHARSFKEEFAHLRATYQDQWLALTADKRAAYDLAFINNTFVKKDADADTNSKVVGYWTMILRTNPEKYLYERLSSFAAAQQQEAVA